MLFLLTPFSFTPTHHAEAQIVPFSPPTAPIHNQTSTNLPSEAPSPLTTCPTGAVLLPDIVNGSVCRVMKTGVTMLNPDANNNCPDGYRLIIEATWPYCTSNVAGNPRQPTDAALLDESEKCPAGQVPMIDVHGIINCETNPQMDPMTVFNPTTDCPVGTYPGKKNNRMGCLQR